MRCVPFAIGHVRWATSNPEFQDALCKGKWREAYQNTERGQMISPIYGTYLPALCEKSCVLKLCDAPSNHPRE